jgi:hypothetical protein
VKAQMGSADNSSSSEACTEAMVVPVLIMSGDDGSPAEICRFKRAAEMTAHGFLVGSSFYLIQTGR